MASGTTIELSSLPRIREAGLDSDKACLPGTRVKALDDLSAWINDPGAPRVRFLLGGAGTGKSSIAHSTGVSFDTLNRLGSFFRFDRTFEGERPLTSVIRTIAHDLADWDPTFRLALANVLHDKRHLIGTIDITKQWEGLILEPLKKVALVGPVLVIIDAFDECSSPETPLRQKLLKLLAERSSELPPNFRILITSRPEHDVAHVLRPSSSDHDSPQISHVFLDAMEETTSDIELFVRHQLLSHGSSSEEALHDTDIRMLVTKAEGLFQWAATACRAVLHNPAGLTLKERFDLRLGTVLAGGPSSLDDLYRSILGQLFNLDEQVLANRFRSIMAQILCTSSPLSIDSLDEMRRLATGVEKDEVTLVVEYMGSLLSGVSARTSPIRPLHTSFRDFLTDKSRSKDWFVDLAAGHPLVVLGCFRIINKYLSFNICALDSSYISNRDIPDLEARLTRFVPERLSYAARNWKDHLPDHHLPSDLLQELTTFSHNKLLFWLELLSLQNAVNRAAPSLEAVTQLCDVSLILSVSRVLYPCSSYDYHRVLEATRSRRYCLTQFPSSVDLPVP